MSVLPLFAAYQAPPRVRFGPPPNNPQASAGQMEYQTPGYLVSPPALPGKRAPSPAGFFWKGGIRGLPETGFSRPGCASYFLRVSPLPFRLLRAASSVRKKSTGFSSSLPPPPSPERAPRMPQTPRRRSLLETPVTEESCCR